VNQLTAFLQLEQNSKLHVGQRTARGNSSVTTAVDDDGCTAAEGEAFSGPTEQIVSQFRLGHQSLYLSSSTSASKQANM